MVNFQQNAAIARAVGIVSIALGFVIGMYGLDHPESIWLRTALGLTATGMVAQGYALYCSIRRARSRKHSQNE
jgi:Kef-type K+ transport system membrane component KefB